MQHNGKNTVGVLSRNLVNEDVLTHWGLSRQKQTNKQQNLQDNYMEVSETAVLKKNFKSSDM
jgi:hypothetical protein